MAGVRIAGVRIAGVVEPILGSDFESQVLSSLSAEAVSLSAEAMSLTHSLTHQAAS